MKSKLDKAMELLKEHFRAHDIFMAIDNGLQEDLAAILSQPDDHNCSNGEGLRMGCVGRVGTCENWEERGTPPAIKGKGK